ncbi:MAG: hypothetical protein O2799_10490, partial [Planctomycetota bacterium]|nr:hypothetical protein [Planctomycetota bacterium]
MRSPSALVLAFSPLLLASCTVSVKTTADLPEPTPAEAASPEIEGASAPSTSAADSERKKAEAARKAAVAEREVRHARMDLELAELE